MGEDRTSARHPPSADAVLRPGCGRRGGVCVALLVIVGLAPWAPPGAVATVPEIDAPVVDRAGVLSDDDEARIAQALIAHREATGVQMAALLVRTTGGVPIEDYAQAVFDRWGGGSAERDDGILFVLAVDDRRSRLQLGYGIEGVISDGQAKSMLDQLRPSLRRADYAEATLALIVAVRERTAEITPGSALPSRPLGSWPAAFALIGLLGLGAGFAWRWRRRRESHADSARGRWEAIAVFLGLPTVVGLVFLGGAYTLAYGGITGAMILVGWQLAASAQRVRWWAILHLLLVGPIVGFMLMAGPEGLEVNALIGATMVALFVGAKFATNPSSGGSSSGSSSWSSSSGGSSSSGSSWSGGGGSSGGGGASSSR